MSRAGILAILVSAVMLGSCASEVPGVIRDEIARTSQTNKGAATIVFFTDFQCPYCRKTHAALAPVLEARRGRVRVVLRHVPLARHPDARTAARAVVCVEKITRPLLDDYAHALSEAPDLSEVACEDMAAERGVDRDRFRRCLGESEIDARIENDIAMFEAIKGDGVPLLYVNGQRLEGAQSRSSLEAAVDAATAGK